MWPKCCVYTYMLRVQIEKKASLLMREWSTHWEMNTIETQLLCYMRQRSYIILHSMHCDFLMEEEKIVNESLTHKVRNKIHRKSQNMWRAVNEKNWSENNLRLIPLLSLPNCWAIKNRKSIYIYEIFNQISLYWFY